MFGPFTSQMLTITQDVTLQFMVYGGGGRVDTKISQSGGSQGEPGPMSGQCSQAIIDRVICQQFLILFDSLIA